MKSTVSSVKLVDFIIFQLLTFIDLLCNYCTNKAATNNIAL